jgi:histone acetyltransferase MYST4
VFGGKKSYQALKGCFERNFNVFKQIHAFESYSAKHCASQPSLRSLPESDRLKEYERRLGIAKKLDYEIGNVTPRVIEHWHAVGWYKLFFDR